MKKDSKQSISLRSLSLWICLLLVIFLPLKDLSDVSCSGGSGGRRIPGILGGPCRQVATPDFRWSSPVLEAIRDRELFDRCDPIVSCMRWNHFQLSAAFSPCSVLAPVHCSLLLPKQAFVQIYANEFVFWFKIPHLLAAFALCQPHLQSNHLCNSSHAVHIISCYCYPCKRASYFSTLWGALSLLMLFQYENNHG